MLQRHDHTTPKNLLVFQPTRAVFRFYFDSEMKFDSLKFEEGLNGPVLFHRPFALTPDGLEFQKIPGTSNYLYSVAVSVPSEGDTYYAAVAVEGCGQDSEILQLSTTVTTFVDEPDENLPP